MKRTTKWIVIGLIALLTFAGVMSCKPGVTIAVRSLKGETILFITDGNGLNYVQYVFNDDATGGEWEWVTYTFDYPDQDAKDRGKYDEQEWYKTGGEKGTFTYDEETGRTTTVTTHVYKRKEGAEGPPPWFKNDYDWATYTQSEIGYGHAADESASKSVEQDSFFNNDQPMLEGFISQGEDTNQWRYYKKTTENVTEAETTTDTETVVTETYTITETQCVYDYTVVVTETVDGGTPTKETARYISTYDVNNFFIGGEETGDTAFDKAWKKGNEVTFMLERTKYEVIEYEGDTEPDPPSSIDDTTGIGEKSDTTYRYTINMTGGATAEWAFLHAGENIFRTSEFQSSNRGLE